MQPWFTEFANAIAEGEPYYRQCTDCGFAAVPPREVCPDCGTRTLENEPLSTVATVETHTTITSSIPVFADDTPYTVVVATFEEGARLTGQLRDGDGNRVEEFDPIEYGDEVELGVEERADGYWILTFTTV